MSILLGVVSVFAESSDFNSNILGSLIVKKLYSLPPYKPCCNLLFRGMVLAGLFMAHSHLQFLSPNFAQLASSLFLLINITVSLR